MNRRIKSGERKSQTDMMMFFNKFLLQGQGAGTEGREHAPEGEAAQVEGEVPRLAWSVQ